MYLAFPAVISYSHILVFAEVKEDFCIFVFLGLVFEENFYKV